MNHIIHDMDRDGWGSTAMLLAELGPANCILHPVGDKNVGRVLAQLPPEAAIVVLDLPAPNDWHIVRHQTITWVDHHLDSWKTPPPPAVRAILPDDNRPTTTMRLLIEARLATMPTAMAFVAGLCRRSPAFDWGLVFDAMHDRAPDVPNLPELLAMAPLGLPVPDQLRPLVHKTADMNETVESVLAASQIRRQGNVLRIDLSDARGIPLRHYSLAAGRRYPGCTRVLVHRRQRLYVGRDSNRPGLDLITHFRNRGLDPKGHAYVCTAIVKADVIDAEIAALVQATETPS